MDERLENYQREAQRGLRRYKERMADKCPPDEIVLTPADHAEVHLEIGERLKKLSEDQGMEPTEDGVKGGQGRDSKATREAAEGCGWMVVMTALMFLIWAMT